MFTRFAGVGASWSVGLDALAQQTAYTLPYGERFKIGGDQGLGAKVEVRRNLANAPPLLRGAALYGFYDLGAA